MDVIHVAMALDPYIPEIINPEQKWRKFWQIGFHTLIIGLTTNKFYS